MVLNHYASYQKGFSMNKIFQCALVLALIGLITFIQGKLMQSEEMKFTSSAFKQGEMIPKDYTCEGKDLFPPLAWDHVPAGTKSFAIIVDDPDAPHGTWVHWVAFNIPGDMRSLDAHALERTKGIIQGITSNPQPGYHGPCPPSGTHRYYFTLYALSSMLDLDTTATKETVLAAAKKHLLGQAQLMGRYQKS